MSVMLMGLVWGSTIKDRTHVDILNYLANCADDDGRNCFPSIARIAKFTRCSERTVQRTIGELSEAGWIELVERGDGRGNFSQFVINCQKLKGCQDDTLSKLGKRVTIRQKRVTLTTEKGDIDDNPPAPPIGRPIIDPSIDPSLFPEDEPRGDSSGEVVSPASKPEKPRKARPSTAQDERFNLFREDHDKAFKFLNNAPAPWDAKESTNLLRWLKANPTITREQWRAILQNRAKSPVQHGDPLSTWISRALNWLNTAKPLTNGGNYGSRNGASTKAGRSYAAAIAVVEQIESRAGARPDGDEASRGVGFEDAGSVRGRVIDASLR